MKKKSTRPIIYWFEKNWNLEMKFILVKYEEDWWRVVIPICLSNLKIDASKGCRQCVQNLQRISKESCETTCKQH